MVSQVLQLRKSLQICFYSLKTYQHQRHNPIFNFYVQLASIIKILNRQRGKRLGQTNPNLSPSIAFLHSFFAKIRNKSNRCGGERESLINNSNCSFYKCTSPPKFNIIVEIQRKERTKTLDRTESLEMAKMNGFCVILIILVISHLLLLASAGIEHDRCYDKCVQRFFWPFNYACSMCYPAAGSTAN